MSKRLVRYAPYLKKLHQYSPRKRVKWMKQNCINDKEFVNCICECARNILGGNVPLSNGQKRTLKKQKNKLRLLSLKKTSQKRKRQIIQSGGFLGAILGPVVSVLGGLLGNVFGGGSSGQQ